MLEQVAAAFERQDYRTAAELLKQMLQKSPQDPWVQFYLGRLHEVSGKLEAAENVYRQLLQSAINSKILAQARQGLQRLEALAKLAEGIATEQRQQAIAQATADPGNNQMGVLVLEPVSTEIKTTAAENLPRLCS